MGKNYYYFASSLPMILFDSKPPMKLEKFLEDCQRFLTEEDFSLCEFILKEKEGSLPVNNKFASNWLEFNRVCCNEIACFRAERDKKDPMEYFRGERKAEPGIITLIQQAGKLDDLLAAEKMLDQAKWQYLEDVTLEHYFDCEFILAFGLKLKILNRYQLFSSDKGQEVFKEYQKLGSPQ